MKPKHQNIEDFFQDRAQEGEAGFAIAYALLRLAHSTQAGADALDSIGMNNKRTGTPPGALEKLAMEVERIAKTLDDRLGDKHR